VGALIDPATLQDAEAEALDCGVATHEVLLARGAVSNLDYADALAHRLGVPAVSWEADLDLADAVDGPATEIGLPAHIAGRPWRVLVATEATPDVLLSHVAVLRAQGMEVALAPQFRIDAALEAHLQPGRIDRAIRGLLREQPASSAGAPFAIWQVNAGAVATGLLIGGLAVLPDATIAALTAVIALPFLCVTALRLVALRQALASRKKKIHAPRPRAQRVPDRLLPTYTVLVPLLREAGMLPGLVHRCRHSIIPQRSSRSSSSWRRMTPRRWQPCWARRCPATSAP
jgi:hypothetical protein